MERLEDYTTIAKGNEAAHLMYGCDDRGFLMEPLCTEEMAPEEMLTRAQLAILTSAFHALITALQAEPSLRTDVARVVGDACKQHFDDLRLLRKQVAGTGRTVAEWLRNVEAEEQPGAVPKDIHALMDKSPRCSS